MDKIKIKCIEVIQPIGTFYIGVINCQDLVDISYADIRRKQGRDIERYIGTQRDLDPKRVNEIRQYVSTVDSCFPTSIILAVDSSNIEYFAEQGMMSIIKDSKVAKIIDGQHRIAGLENFSGPTFELNVTIFIDMDIEDQAMVFSTINLKQTKVTKSLAYDLYEYAKSRSPQKTCHNIAKLLNSKEGSPFKDRIKILGRATGIETELITQASFVDRLLLLITRDAMNDRDRIKRNLTLERYDDKCIFRDRFIKEKDAEIAKILWNYFGAVNLRWQKAWNNFERGMILARTTGFAALMRILPNIIIETGNRENIVKQEVFYNILIKSKINDDDFTSENFKPGSSGESELVKRLITDLFPNKKSLNSYPNLF
jgi:DGQHR domain-containing protein